MEEQQARETPSQARALVLEVRAAFDQEHAAQVRQVELIDQLCRASRHWTPPGPAIPGQERLLPTGADGTPLVAEHLATELAPQLRVSIESAWALISEAIEPGASPPPAVGGHPRGAIAGLPGLQHRPAHRLGRAVAGGGKLGRFPAGPRVGPARVGTG